MTPIKEKIRVMIVDDSAVMRGLWTKVLSSETFTLVVATAPNGAAATEFLRHNQVDVVILDLEMPVMDGLTAIPIMLSINPSIKIIVASGTAISGSRNTVEALTLGAIDFIGKPAELSASAGVAKIAGELLKKIKAISFSPTPPGVMPPAKLPNPAPIRTEFNSFQAKLVVIGASTGGPNALSDVLKGLPPNMSQPILIVQHMPPLFTALLAERFASETKRLCTEASDGQQIMPRGIYVAPGGYHMSIKKEGSTYRIVLDANAAPENFCRPAVDVLFRSAATHFGKDSLAVVLTGMGEDGRRGAEAIVQRGGYVIAQDEESSVVWGMPGAIVSHGLASFVLPLADIPNQITKMCTNARKTII